MTPDEYVKEAVRSEMNDALAIKMRAGEHSRLLHAAMGMVTESGEFMDALKKAIIYGKPLDKVNLAEELGDQMWYIAVACDALGVPLGNVMGRNVAKLRARYPEKYSNECALNRDLEKERGILEQ